MRGWGGGSLKFVQIRALACMPAAMSGISAANSSTDIQMPKNSYSTPGAAPASARQRSARVKSLDSGAKMP